MRAASFVTSVAFASAALQSVESRADVPIDFKAKTVLFGDNTEFFNRYRSGETTLGAHIELALVASLSKTIDFRVGVFGLERFGSETSFELARPVVSLRLGSDANRFIFGVLDTARDDDESRLGRVTLHGLVPPLQVEKLALSRPFEAGAQWTIKTKRATQDTWVSWQKLNTPEHREVIDTGLVARVRLFGPLWFGAQFHLVHHGGQQYRVGPVTDRFGAGPGLIVQPGLSFVDLAALEVYALYSKENIRDTEPTAPTSGRGLFTRLTIEKVGWRGHAIYWRAADFYTEEGDSNYLGRLKDGTPLPGARDYAELGLSKVFRPAAGLRIEASAQLHLTDSKLEYSYRLTAAVSLDFPITGRRGSVRATVKERDAE